MAEKVLFEYRAEREESGYRYEFRYGNQRVEIKSSAPFACRMPGIFGARLAGAKQGRRAFHHGGILRRKARKTLGALERMYQDIYGRDIENPKPEVGAVE
jgi:hypothetical protein